MSKKKKKQNIFDYIIIGAGTSGGVIAKGLTDDKETSVLVLEPGTNMTAQLSSANILDAIVQASENKYAFNIISKIEDKIERSLLSTNGRTIGGSSEINYMLAVRGSRELYDQWAEIVGPKFKEHWKYDNIRSLFIINETYTGETEEPNERGTDGPIFVRQQMVPPNGLIETLVNATSIVLGIDIVKDYNTGVRDCTFFKSQFTQKETMPNQFERSSTATGYLNENIVTQGNGFQSDEFGVNERKLVIFAKTTVNKILFKKKKGMTIAVGVEFVKDGVSERRFAKKGIIVSAGFHSSIILQRSGIGDPSDLANAGIKTLISNSNVGHNLQTHAYAALGVEVDTTQIVPVILADLNQPVALGAFKAENTLSSEGRRLQLSGAPAPFFLPVQDVIKNGWSLDLGAATNVMSFGMVDLNPRSTGVITVAHSDPEAPPSLTFNPLQNQDDLDFLVNQYINMYNIILEARSNNSGIHKIVYPPEEIFELPEAEKRQKLEVFVKASFSNFYHFGGQCRMGQSINDGVVDGELNVFGTKNLKVADLSISPILPDGNTSLPAQMIGLNCVRFIRETHHPYVNDDELEDFEDESEDYES